MIAVDFIHMEHKIHRDHGMRRGRGLKIHRDHEDAARVRRWAGGSPSSHTCFTKFAPESHFIDLSGHLPRRICGRKCPTIMKRGLAELVVEAPNTQITL